MVFHILLSLLRLIFSSKWSVLSLLRKFQFRASVAMFESISYYVYLIEEVFYQHIVFKYFVYSCVDQFILAYKPDFNRSFNFYVRYVFKKMLTISEQSLINSMNTVRPYKYYVFNVPNSIGWRQIFTFNIS